MRIGSLFSGGGGLDMAIEQVFGGEVAWHCEVDPAASKVLAAHWPGVLNHRDITAVNWVQVEPVDVLCGGWPCQPFSLAGKRKGIDDERALWPHVARAVGLLRPRYVVLENVAAVLRSPEFDRVANSLAEIGYGFSWTCVRASGVGAPHRRERLFVIAHADGTRLESVGPSGFSQEHWAELVRYSAATEPLRLLPTPGASDTRGRDLARATRDGSGGDDLVTAVINGYATQWREYAAAIGRWGQITRPAPYPTERTRTGNPRLAPAFSEWMMGWPTGWVTQVDGISRNDQLKIIGNGVVPQQATAAITYLLNVARAA